MDAVSIPACGHSGEAPGIPPGSEVDLRFQSQPAAIRVGQLLPTTTPSTPSFNRSPRPFWWGNVDWPRVGSVEKFQSQPTAIRVRLRRGRSVQDPTSSFNPSLRPLG